MLDAGGETTWDTERGHQPPRGGSGELPGSEHHGPAPEHHPPSSHRTRGCQRSWQPGDPHSRRLVGGTQPLLSNSPGAKQHRAEQHAVLPPSPPHTRGCRFSPQAS